MTQKTETNFDCYLDIQLQDPEFAVSFEQADKNWDMILHNSCRSIIENYDHA